MTLRVAGGTEYDVEVSAVTESGERVVDAITSEYIPIDVDPADPQRLVGAHYYPWYEMADGHRNWTDRVVSRPALGEYASDSERIVDRHVAWSLAHGIRWWSISWWGAGSGTDVALRETVLEADRVDELEFSVLYETVGRFGEFDLDMDRPGARRRLAADLTYLENEYFHRDNYLHIDGRPVVYFYVAGGLEGDVAGAFDAAAADLDVDPYVLAGVPFGRPPTGPVMAVADGLSPYNPYDAREDIETVFHDRYEAGNKMLDLGARAADVDMIPVVIPGYDDTGLPARIREDNPVLSASPERFERVCDQVNPHLADAPAVLVTSFNEWYEDTQIEPDETHGEAYLDTVAAKLASADSRGFDPTGAMLEMEFDRAIQPDGSSRHLSFMATRIAFAADGRSLVSYDIGGSPEPLYVGECTTPNPTTARRGGGSAARMRRRACSSMRTSRARTR
ncbi:glycoside hydrolase family 99-like domain-containing protein [Halobaculum litoreum]|uniref:Glycoside hydrolase family 99-like domain-containing protein n=1 Tax=Halobaculum litoreum TaxID=3031998 RepID=A0ABD5XSR0_9EURY